MASSKGNIERGGRARVGFETAELKCGLCGGPGPIRESHVVPDFVGRWLIETSGTPFLRDAVTPNRRKQRITTVRLLCSKCESRFSLFEHEFVHNLFYPYQRHEVPPAPYAEWCLKFIVSVSWRLLVTVLERLCREDRVWETTLRTFERQWREFLLDNSSVPGPGAHHLFFAFPWVFQADAPFPDKFFSYIFRGLDGTPVIAADHCYVFSNLCGILIVSFMSPEDPDGWEGTHVLSRGAFPDAQRVGWVPFGPFLFDRSKEVFRRPLSGAQREHLRSTVEKHRERYLGSRDFQIHRWEVAFRAIESKHQRKKDS